MLTTSAILMVQTRRGMREYVMRAELLNLDGVVLIGEEEVGARTERVFLEVIFESGGASDAVSIVGSVVCTIPGVGTKVRFELGESPPRTLEHLRRYIEEYGLLAATSDYPLTVFASVSGT